MYKGVYFGVGPINFNLSKPQLYETKQYCRCIGESRYVAMHTKYPLTSFVSIVGSQVRTVAA